MLNRLAEVQTLDLELDSLLQERGQVPTELLEAMEHRRSLERTIEIRTQELGDLRRSVNANELELKSLEERRRSAAANAVRASSPKEVSQFQNQELQFGTRVQELEEDTLPLMESQDRLAEVVAALESELAELLPVLEGLDLAEQE